MNNDLNISPQIKITEAKAESDRIAAEVTRLSKQPSESIIRLAQFRSRVAEDLRETA